jgi:hypothetical protein
MTPDACVLADTTVALAARNAQLHGCCCRSHATTAWSRHAVHCRASHDCRRVWSGVVTVAAAAVVHLETPGWMMLRH